MGKKNTNIKGVFKIICKSLHSILEMQWDWIQNMSFNFKLLLKRKSDVMRYTPLAHLLKMEQPVYKYSNQYW